MRPGRVGERHVTVVELHAKARVGQQLQHRAFEFEQSFLDQ